jgi:hypothetical protein
MDNLPTSWLDITFTQYLELKELESDKNITGIELLFEQLAVLFDTDTEDPDLQDLTDQELFELMNELKWLAQTPKAELPNQWREFAFRSLNQLTLGEFIDAEHMLQLGLDGATRLCAIIMKQWQVDLWGNRQFEPYEYDLDDRAAKFDHMPVSYISGIIQEYETWKRDFMLKYDPLFQDTSVEPKEEQEELEGPARIEKMKEEKIEQAQKQWSWESTIWSLTNGDISRFESVFNTSVILVFNVLSMRKMLDI